MTREPLVSVTAKDLDISYFRAGGKGGQHQNKTSSACRIKHPPSGAVAESREHREQPQNRKAAFRKLAADPRFTNWLALETAEAQRRLDGKETAAREAERLVEEAMAPEHLLVEVKVDGVWVPE